MTGFSPAARFFLLLGAALLVVAVGLAIGETFFGLIVPADDVLLAVPAGAGGLSLATFLALGTPGVD
jgi:hypothetical protein